jgi:integrase
MARPKKIPHKKRADGTYEAKVTVGYDINNKPIRKSFYSSKSFEDAKVQGERYKYDLELAVQRGEAVAPGTITFETVAKQVLAQKKMTVRQTTYEMNWVMIFDKYLIPEFGNKDIAKITLADIEMYFTKHSDKAKATLEKHLSFIKIVFKYAMKNRYITYNPLEYFSLELGQKPHKKEVYTPEQAELILEYANSHRFGLEIELLLKYGMSRSELLGIKLSDVDFEKRTIHIQRGVTVSRNGGLIVSETKNEYRNRVIAIDAETTEKIKKLNTEYVVSTKNNTAARPDGWYNKHYKIFMRDMIDYYRSQGVEIPFRNPHELRHTRATIWVNEGKSPYAIAKQLGWSDLEMLMKVYGHPDMDLLRKELGL